jgi:hypothetical protein
MIKEVVWDCWLSIALLLENTCIYKYNIILINNFV